MNKFFNFYSKGNVVIKVLFLGVALVMGALWIVGSFTKLDRLTMFLVGTIVGGVLINLFLYDHVVNAITYVSNFISGL